MKRGRQWYWIIGRLLLCHGLAVVANTIVALLGLLVLGFGLSEIQTVVENPPQGLLLFNALLSTIIITAIVFVLARWVDRRTLAEVGWNAPERPRWELLLALLLGMSAPALKALILWGIWGYAIQGLRASQGAAAYVLLAVLTVASAWREEILFRGYTLANLNDRFKPILSGLFSALVFAVFHFGAELTWAGALSYLLMGLLFALSFYYSRSLWLPLWIHAIYNFSYKLLFNETYGVVVFTAQASTAVADIADAAGMLIVLFLFILVVVRVRRKGTYLWERAAQPAASADAASRRG